MCSGSPLNRHHIAELDMHASWRDVVVCNNTSLTFTGPSETTCKYPASSWTRYQPAVVCSHVFLLTSPPLRLARLGGGIEVSTTESATYVLPVLSHTDKEFRTLHRLCLRRDGDQSSMPWQSPMSHCNVSSAVAGNIGVRGKYWRSSAYPHHSQYITFCIREKHSIAPIRIGSSFNRANWKNDRHFEGLRARG